MITDEATYDKALRALIGAYIVDPQPRNVDPERAASHGRIGDDAVLPGRCPECCEAKVDPVAVVYEGRWQCRFCGTWIRLAYGRDRGISDPAHGDLYVRVVRPGEPLPRPVCSTSVGGFRGEPWRPAWEDDGPEPAPAHLDWIEFDTFDPPAWVVVLIVTLVVLIAVLVVGAAVCAVT